MSTFRFQQFAVRQTDSAMKICTDATLFGAMTPLRGGERVLDIGTGTGLLALMAVQRGASRVTAVELDAQAHAEACHNFAQSPWTKRLHAVHGPVQDFCRNTTERYDLILCNPPFFENHYRATDPGRNQARHTDPLPYTELVACLDRLLMSHGLCYLLLPVHTVRRFSGLALRHGLHLVGRTDFRGHAHNRAKVSALTYTRQPAPCQHRLLTIYQAERVYSAESAHYLAAFLLRFVGAPEASACPNLSVSA
jgi:tRNA1Val (adenine37-N6)-methyltransferase